MSPWRSTSGIPPEEAIRQSDPFLIQAALPLWSRRQIAERLGGEFAAGVSTLPLGEWSPPIPSSYGEHIVWLHEREPERLPDLSEVRRRVESTVYRERQATLRLETLALLREDYRIEIAEP